MVYADFENNGKQNLDGFYKNKYQKHPTCSYCYKYHVLMINLPSLLS